MINFLKVCCFLATFVFCFSPSSAFSMEIDYEEMPVQPPSNLKTPSIKHQYLNVPKKNDYEGFPEENYEEMPELSSSKLQITSLQRPDVKVNPYARPPSSEPYDRVSSSEINQNSNKNYEEMPENQSKTLNQKDVDAFNKYLEDAQKNDLNAQKHVADAYFVGQGVIQNYSKALEWFLKCAQKNDPWAQKNIGFMYENGRGVKKDEKEAVKLYQLAADQGDPSAQFNLGVMYANGRGVKKDEKEALKWYQKAADQGHVNAQKAVEKLKKKLKMI